MVSTVERKFAKAALKGVYSVENAFRKIDTDHSGVVTTGEFVEALRRQGALLVCVWWMQPRGVSMAAPAWLAALVRTVSCNVCVLCQASD